VLLNVEWIPGSDGVKQLFQNHRREHGQYLRQLGVLIEAYGKSETGLPDLISAFLEQWLVRHVSESDLRYARYFKANQK
jgi:hemerythrin